MERIFNQAFGRSNIKLTLLLIATILTRLSFEHCHSADTILYNLGGDMTPTGSLAVSNSKLYGAAYGNGGGFGAIFSMNTDGSQFMLLHSFKGGSDGGQPNSPILVGRRLYGTTVGQIDAYNYGTIYSINTDGSGFTLLRNFTYTNSNEGDRPIGALTLVGTTLYGITTHGGATHSGNIFSVNTDGSEFRVMYSFKEWSDAAPLSDRYLMSVRSFME